MNFIEKHFNYFLKRNKIELEQKKSIEAKISVNKGAEASLKTFAFSLKNCNPNTKFL